MKISSLSFILAGLFLFYGLMLPDNSYAQTGSLTVNITPDAAAVAGAQWRWLDPNTGVSSGLMSSGDQVSLPHGDYIIDFQLLQGWIAPPPENVTITDEPTTVAGQYQLPDFKGHIKVEIEPKEARDVGAQWRIVAPPGHSPINWPWRDSGDTEVGVPIGEYMLEFSDVEGWVKPVIEKVVIERDKTTEFPGPFLYRHPAEYGGSLQVIIEPEIARDDGARWRVVGATDWLESGETVKGLPVEQDIWIEFNLISGWTSPSMDSPIRVEQGKTKTETAVYKRTALGSLQVIIEPSGARDAGAQWRRAGTTNWFDSGVTEEGIPPDDYEIEFSLLSGWGSPDNIDVTIEAGRTKFVTGYYLLSSLGSLQVVINPSGARDAGAQWRRAGTTNWFDSGVTEEGIPPGNYEVEFKSIHDWVRPNNGQRIPVEIESGLTTFESGEYTADIYGSINVIITPEHARIDGARWRRVDTQDWLKSGEIEYGVPVGSYTIEFKDITGWSPPLRQHIVVNQNENSVLTGEYRRKPVSSLHVTIEPEQANNDGARWRVSGNNEWLQSDEKNQNLAPGRYWVEVNDLPGWIKPSNIEIEVFEGQTSYTTRVFTKAGPGSLQVTLKPDEVVSLGAKWRLVGASEWLESGEALNNVSSGIHSVEFSSVDGWTNSGEKRVNVLPGVVNSVSVRYFQGTLPGVLMLLLGE